MQVLKQPLNASQSSSSTHYASSKDIAEAREKETIRRRAEEQGARFSLKEYDSTSKDPTEPLQRKGQKRRRDSEDESSEGKFSDKRRRKDSRPVEESVLPLNEANLGKLAKPTESRTSEDMVNKEKPASRRSSTTGMNEETASVSSSQSKAIANYRWKNLEYVRIFVEKKPLPEKIQCQINAIIQPELSEERKSELSLITETLCKNFVVVLGGASREDDLLEPIHTALASMDSGDKFTFPRKTDWDSSLKPNVPRRKGNFNFLKKSSNDADDILNPSSKQRPETPSVSSDAPESIMPPPPSPPKSPSKSPPKTDISALKTPRPDITIGFHHSVLVETLKAPDLSELEASDFLKFLEDEQVLCSNATLPEHGIRFPSMVVEGKSYSTGTNIFEAQNQAAVAGSCMTNLQHKLAELTECASPGSNQSKEPLAFSICTQGPYMELWGHYTTLVDGVRMYNMKLLKICHASLPGTVTEFFMAVDGVMSWASSDLLDDIAKQLALLWRAERQHTT